MVFASPQPPKLPLPVTSPPFSPSDLARMKERVPEVAELLRFMATPSRLLLLCQLAQGEMTVGGLEDATGIRQPALSQQLAELRQRKLVATRRESRSIIYRMADPRVAALLGAMHGIFCADDAST
jgi:DNA-binding transcriptional ArsR family regulator